MTLELPNFESTARLSYPHPVSAEEFWEISQRNSDLRMERLATGELLIMSPTGFEGGAMEGEVFAELRTWALADRRGKAFASNTGITLPDTSVRAADACWISWEKVNVLSPEERKGFAHVVPEFIIEIRSFTDSLAELREKMEHWIANGVELAWLIDPSRKAVEIYRPGQSPEIQEGHSAVYGEGPVGGFVLELGRIWG